MLHGPCTGRYVWERRAFPWLVTWEENYSRAGLSARWPIIVATYISRYSLRRTLQRTARRGPEWPMRSHALPAHVLRSALQHSTLRRNTVPQRRNAAPRVATGRRPATAPRDPSPMRSTHSVPSGLGLPSALAAVWLVSYCAFVDADGVRRAVRPYAVMYPYTTLLLGPPIWSREPMRIAQQRPVRQ